MWIKVLREVHVRVDLRLHGVAVDHGGIIDRLRLAEVSVDSLVFILRAILY